MFVLLVFLLLSFLSSPAYSQNSTLSNYSHVESRDLDRINVKWADLFDYQSKANRVIIAVDVSPQGEVFVLTYGNGIKKVAADGTLQNFIGGSHFKSPMDFAINSEGKFFVAVNSTEGKNIKVFSPAGTALAVENFSDGTYGTGLNRFKGPVGLAFDSMDNLYVADHYIGDQQASDRSRIKIFYKINGSYKNSQFLEFASVEGTDIVSPFRIAVNKEGLIFVSDEGSEGKGRVLVIKVVNRVPTLVDVLAGAEDNIGSPGDIVIDQLGYIYIADLGTQLNLPVILNAGNDPYKLINYFDIVKNGIRNEVFKIRVYNPQRQYQGYLLNEIDLPLDMAIDICGDLYVNNLVLSGSTGSPPLYLGLDATLDFDLEVYARSPSGDLTPPVALCLGAYEISLAAGETFTLDPGILDNGSYDACGGVTLDLSRTAFTEADAGPVAVNLVVIDDNGNKSSCQVLVQVNVETVADTDPPVIDCPGDMTTTNDPGKCGAVVTFSEPSATDNSGAPTVVQTEGPASGSLFPVGSTTLTFTATDAAGNAVECSYEVIVEDNEAPVFTSCPENISETVAVGETEKIVTYSAPQFIDNCSGASLELTSGFSSGESFPVGETKVTFVVTDVSGKTATCSFVVSVIEEEDTESPVIECPDDRIITSDPGKCGAVVTFSEPNATDNSGAPTVVQTEGPASGSLFPVGSTTLTFIATDAAGNTVECSYEVIVEDNEAPVFTSCPGDIYGTVAAGETDMAITFLTPEYTDNCSDTNFEQTAGSASGEKFGLGETTVIFVITDGAGNSNSCSFKVVITEEEDTDPPVFDCPDPLNFLADEDQCGTILNFPDPVVSDPSGILQLVQTAGPTSGTFVEVGNYAVTYMATDNAGNSTYCTFYLNVQDERKPQIDCPGEVEVAANASGEFIVPNFRNLVSDNCEVASVEQNPSAGTGIQAETEVTLVATDNSGNLSECKIQLKLTQEEILQITSCAIPRKESLGADCSFVLGDYTPEITTNLEASLVQEPPAGTVITESTTVVITAERGENKVDCSFLVEVEDNTVPQQVCPGNKTVTFDPEVGFELPFYGDESMATDNCNVQVLQDPPPGTMIFQSRAIHLTAVDSAGNQSQCSFSLILEEEQQTEIRCREVVLSLDSEGTAVLDPAAVFDGNANDPEIDGLEVSKTEFSCLDVGKEQSVELTVTYTNGTTATCTARVQVVDEIFPIISCNAAISKRLNAVGSLTVTPEDIAPGVSDNCGVEQFYLDKKVFTEADMGDNPVTVTAIDASGNIATCQTTLTILPYEGGGGGSGGITCPMHATIPLDENGEVTIDILYEGDADVQFDIDKDFFTCDDIGTHPITVTYTGDYNGTCSSAITIVDVSSPTANCISSFDLVLNSDGTGTISPDDLDSNSTDNCGIAKISLSRTDFTTADIGQQQVVLTVRDSSGNESVCTVNVNVKAYEGPDPDFQCVESIHLELDENGEAVINPRELFTGGTGSGEYSISKEKFDCRDIGKQKIIFNYKTSTEEGSCEIEVIVSDPSNHCDLDPAPPQEGMLIVLYPNPSRGLFKVKTSAEMVLEKVKVFDMRGRFLCEQDLLSQRDRSGIYTVDIRDFQAGVYNLRFISGEKEYLRRAIIAVD